MVVRAMITPHSPLKLQPSPLAMETTPLMVLTPHKAKISTSPLDLEMTILSLVKIAITLRSKLAQAMTT